jgi:hypothetical protein
MVPMRAVWLMICPVSKRKYCDNLS